MPKQNFKQDIDARLAGLTLSPVMREKIKAGAGVAPTPKKRKPMRLRRTLVTIAAACMAMVFGLAAAATAFPGFETFIANMGEDLRQLVQPIAEEITDDGICMQVVAAVNDGDTAVVYITLQDLEGDRIDETTELYDRNLGDGMMGFAHMVYFDEETRTATYRMESMGTETVSGKKITVNVSALLSGGEWQENIATGLYLSDVMALNAQPAIVVPDPLGSMGFSYSVNPATNKKLEGMMEQTSIAVLQPDANPTTLPKTDLLTISNIGIVDGFLHIQQKPQEMERLNIILPYLMYPGQSDERPLAVAYASFGTPETYGDGVYAPYNEHIFELPQDVPPQDVQLALTAYTYQLYVEGNWKVTFVLDESPPVRTAECAIDMNPWLLQNITVSNVGVTGYGTGETTEYSDYLDIVITLDDGSTVEYAGSVSMRYNDDDSFSIKYNFARPINPEDIQTVTVNGQVVPLQNQ